MGICNDQICNCALRSATLNVTGSGTPGDPWVLEQAEFSDITEIQNDIANIEALLASLGSTYVNVTGDSMSGSLIIDSATGPQLSLRHVSDTPFAEWRSEDGSTRMGYAQAVLSTNLLRLIADTGFALAFGTNGSEKARILTTGDVLIEKTASGIGTGGIEFKTGARIWSTADTLNLFNQTLNRIGAADANGQKYTSYQSGGSEIGSVTRATASTVAYNTSSDEEKKQNIRSIPDTQALNLMRQIEPFLFEWRVSPNDATIGYVAQRVAAMWPESIKHGLVTPPTPGIPVGDPRYGWQMDYSKIVPLLHAALQAVDRRFDVFKTQAQTQVADLQAQITALTARVAVLEAA
jgi:hypothetical protein